MWQEQLISQIDDQIKKGQIHKAQQLLLKLKRSDVPFEFWYDIANLARRAQMPYFVLQWLNSIVRPEKSFDANKVQPKHISLYANALTRIGSYKEAEALLEKIKPSDDTQLFFYFALLEMQQWNNRSASNYLKKYLKVPGLPEYNLKIGKLNLAATLSSVDEYEESLEVIDDVLRDTPKKSLLEANLLEIRGQNLFHLEHFEDSKKALLESISIFSQSSNTYRYYAEKWLMFNQVFDPKSKDFNNINNLDHFKAKALKDYQWEVVRDCDFFKSYLTDDIELLYKIYFGTRFKHYNQRILKYFGHHQAPPKEFSLRMVPVHSEDLMNRNNLNHNHYQNKNQNLIFNREQGVFTNNFDTAIDHLPLKLFQLLTTDTYQPFHLGELFSVIYENEYFNPHSSPQKLSRLIARLRKSLESQNIPVQVVLKNKQLYLKYLNDFCININLTAKKKSYFNYFALMISKFKDTFFNSQDVEKLLGVSRRTAKRILQTLVQEKQIQIRKQGPRTVYRLKDVILQKMQ